MCPHDRNTTAATSRPCFIRCCTIEPCSSTRLGIPTRLPGCVLDCYFDLFCSVDVHPQTWMMILMILDAARLQISDKLRSSCPPDCCIFWCFQKDLGSWQSTLVGGWILWNLWISSTSPNSLGRSCRFILWKYVWRDKSICSWVWRSWIMAYRL